MTPFYKDVVILCPSLAKSGGPEALHQLGHRINQNGGNAMMAYHGAECKTSITVDNFMRCYSAPSPLPEYYARYEPRVLNEVLLTKNTLLVFSELIWEEALGVPAGTADRAIWWLSVDNAMVGDPRLHNEAYKKRLFGDPHLIHLYQSEYALNFLKNNNALIYYPVSDYTDPLFIQRGLSSENNPPINQRTNRICHFPNKGAALAKRFFTNNQLQHSIQLTAIRDMTKQQVCDKLFDTRIYIDFGHHPGKDRVPREAAIAGAVVLLHAEGAAKYYGDHPLPAEYLFTQEQIDSGALRDWIDRILFNPVPHFQAQERYRRSILLEYEKFDHEVRRFFFNGI